MARGFIDKGKEILQRLFGRKPAKTPGVSYPKVSLGPIPRGVAAGSLPYRRAQQRLQAGLPPTATAEEIQATGATGYTPAEMAKWEVLSPGFAEEFLYQGIQFRVHSSNVSWLQYNHEIYELKVGFLDGSVYRYFNISIPEASEFLVAPSKGGSVWDILRIRGTRCGHKKGYIQIVGTRKNPCH